MEINEYIRQKKEAYNIFLEYIDCEDDEDENEKYQNFIDILNEQNILEDKDEIYEFLIIINEISKNHHRHPNFIPRIEKAIIYFESRIKQTFTNFQLFNIFRHNKRVILFLFQRHIINFEPEIYQIITDDFKTHYLYFYNEIKDQISIENKKKMEKMLLSIDQEIFLNFEERCQTGENDSYLCTMIRNDSIDDFISYVTRKGVKLTNTIVNSVFETNLYLVGKQPSLIEYAAFHGSIQIFQYLRLNNVDLNPSLWLYAIHGKNPEIIHLLEEDRIELDYKSALDESIKCHHNDIVNYFENIYSENLIKKDGDQNSLKKFISSIANNIKSRFHNQNQVIVNKVDYETKVRICFKYHNYEFLPDDFNNPFLFKYFCEYNYISFCKLFFKYNIANINQKYASVFI